MAENDLTRYLETNPRMMGVLFTMLLLLSQAGNGAAEFVSGSAGP